MKIIYPFDGDLWVLAIQPTLDVITRLLTVHYETQREEPPFSLSLSVDILPTSPAVFPFVLLKRLDDVLVTFRKDAAAFCFI